MAAFARPAPCPFELPGFTLDSDPDDRRRWLVASPDDAPDTRLTRAVEKLRTTGLADTIIRPYARAGLKFFSWHWHASAATVLPFDPFDPEEGVRTIMQMAIERLRGVVRTSTTEMEVRHIEASEGDEGVLEVIKDMVAGAAYLYEGLIANKHYGFANPILLPPERRRSAFIPEFAGKRNVRRILTKFFFRVAGVERPGPRVEDPTTVTRVVKALEEFRNCPMAVIFIAKVAIWGLARLREQVRLTIWDWWSASRFKAAIATTNKGKGERRTKTQLIPDDLVGEITAWANADRVALDRFGRSLDEWRAFLLDERETMKERMEQAKATPLFPNARKGFYSPSGVRDVWYSPAMRTAGLPTRFHFLRHAGVCDAIEFIDSLDISEQEKEKRKVAFGRQLGWAWPERMIAWYGTAAIKTVEIEVAVAWQRDRRAHMERIAAGLAPAVPRRREQRLHESPTDSALKRALGFRRGAPAARAANGR